MAQVESIWRAVPLHALYVQRHCGSCREVRAFESSGRFCVNANGKKLDVWLIYGCLRCAYTGNRSIERRRTEADIGASWRIELRRPWPCGVRLDRLLAAELGASRSAIHRAARSDELVIESSRQRGGALRRPIGELQWIVLAPGFVARVRRE